MSVRFDERWLREYCERTGTAIPQSPSATAPFTQGSLKERPPEEGRKGRGDHLADVGKMVEPPEGKKRTKYGNRRVAEGGRTFDSQHERDVYNELMLEARAGKYCAVLCQVAFTLPGGVKYIADFVTLEIDGKYEVWDAKSYATAKDKVYRLKKRLMRECLGIEIREA